ncbi:hypothetical protein MTO96_016391 [Rhipicephalus appendiculatus]
MKLASGYLKATRGVLRSDLGPPAGLQWPNKDGSVKALLGVAAPVYLAPLLLIKNLALPCAVVLVVLLTVLETLPLAVVSLVPWVATALLGHSTSAYEDVLDLSGTELVSLTGFLVVYVMVDSTRLWTKLSALLLRWQGVRVAPLFASLMFVAFTASLVLPAAFITLLLAAFVCRHLENIKAHVAALQGRVDLRQAQTPVLAAPARYSKVRPGGDRSKPRAGQPVTPGSRRVSQTLPVPESGPSAALVRIDDIARQLVTALRSVCTDYPLLMRSKRRSQHGHFRDVPTSSNSAAVHESAISTTSVLERSRSKLLPPPRSSHRPRFPSGTLGVPGRSSPRYGDEVDEGPTSVPSVRSLWSIRRSRSRQTLSGSDSPCNPLPQSRSQSVEDAADSKALASRSNSQRAGTPPHSSQLLRHSTEDGHSGSSTPRDHRYTGTRPEEVTTKTSTDKSRRSRLLKSQGSPTLRITCVGGRAARRPSKGSPPRRSPPRRADAAPAFLGDSWLILHPPPLASPSDSPDDSAIERSRTGMRRTSSPLGGLPPSPRTTPPAQLEQQAGSSPQSLRTESGTLSRSRSKTDIGQQPSSPSGPVSAPSTVSRATSSSGVASPATSALRQDHMGVLRSYSSVRSGSECFFLSNGSDSPDMYRRFQKVLIVGAAYTSIIAGECGFKGRTRLIINDYYATQKQPSPLNTALFTYCLVPASLASIVLFLVFMYHFYLKQVDLASTPELRVAIHEICKVKCQQEDRLSMREIMVALLLIAIGISLIVDTEKHIWVDWTTVSSLCAVVAAGLPHNAMPRDHVITWPLVLRHMPWELIMVRLGGSALQVVAEGSMVPSWLLETVLLGNMDTRMHSAWCLVALMAATALVCEVDSAVAGPRLVYKLIHLSEQFKLHPLYFALPVVMQSRCVMLVPYMSTPLAFLHLYAPHTKRRTGARSWELLGYFVPLYLSPFLYFGGKGAYLFAAFLPLSWWVVGTLPKALAGFVPVVLLPLLRLEAEDNFVARYYSVS